MGVALGHVLVLAPYRRDSRYISQLLTEHRIVVSTIDDSKLTESLGDTGSVLVTTYEALSEIVIGTVAGHLEAQPAWSEMPIVVLLDKASPSRQLRAALAERWPRSRLLFYERPVSAIELLSGIQSALLMRSRQREVGDHIEREVELRRELNHRVKNILASVSSIFQMTMRGADTLEELNADFSGRLRALMEVHGAVFESDGEAVAMRDIAELTFAPYRVKNLDRIVTDGPELLLIHDAATTLALCLHELATNAIKYGALSVPKGQVSFAWRVDGEDVSMRWKERLGPKVRTPEKAGYGTKYIRAALTSLMGIPPKFDFSPEGLLCEITGPVRRISRN